MNPVALSVATVPVVVTEVLGIRIAESVGDTQRKSLCKTAIQSHIFTTDSFSTLSRTLIVKSPYTYCRTLRVHRLLRSALQPLNSKWKINRYYWILYSSDVYTTWYEGVKLSASTAISLSASIHNFNLTIEYR